MTVRKIFSSGSWGNATTGDFEPMSDELERRLTEHEIWLTYNRGVSLGDTIAAIRESAFVRSLREALVTVGTSVFARSVKH